jgi:hypothetical protein
MVPKALLKPVDILYDCSSAFGDTPDDVFKNPNQCDKNWYPVTTLVAVFSTAPPSSVEGSIEASTGALGLVLMSSQDFLHPPATIAVNNPANNIFFVVFFILVILKFI